MIRVLSAVLMWVWGQGVWADSMRLAVTTSFENAGLADVLLPAIREDLGIEVQLLVVGTGQALRLGAAGDVDAVLVHARAAEDAFVAAGHATGRHEIMYNDFVLIGPADDPAGVASAQTAVAAFRSIQGAAAPFVSRGDDSGTHTAELRLWQSADLPVQDFGPWYRPVGAGMGAALNTAAAMEAYVLADRASWLTFKNKGGLDLLFAGDPMLFNQYAYLPIDPGKHDAIRGDLATAVRDWLLGPAAADLINGYTLEGEPLFVFNGQGE